MQERENSTWLKVTVPSDARSRDALINYLFELGSSGCEEREAGIEAYFPGVFKSAPLLAKIRGYATALEAMGFALTPTDIRAEMLPGRDWGSEWKKFFTPIVVTDKIFVTPTWCKSPAPKREIALKIDPGMAFGTGNHATTRLLLVQLENAVRDGDAVLDVGTGTGIAAIAAKKLGAAPVYAVDIDHTAVDTARANVRKNRCTARTFLWTGSISSIRDIQFDLVLANIISQQLKPLLPGLSQLQKTGGRLLLSGMLKKELGVFEALLRKCALTVECVAAEEEWVAITALKK